VHFFATQSVCDFHFSLFFVEPKVVVVTHFFRALTSPQKKTSVQQKMSVTSKSSVMENKLVVLDGVIVDEIVYPNVLPDDEPRNGTWMIFRGKLANTANLVTIKGSLTKADHFHKHTLTCTREADKYNKNAQAYKIIRVNNTCRVPLSKTTLAKMMMDKLNFTRGATSERIRVLSEASKAGSLPNLVKEVGDTTWFKTLEKRLPAYFLGSYMDDLAAVFSAERIALIPASKIPDLYRLVLNDAWSLCFYWQHDFRVLGEITHEDFANLINKFGLAIGPDQVQAVQTYHNIMRNRKRDERAYLMLEDVKTMCPGNQLQYLIKRGVLKIKSEQSEDGKWEPHVYSVGDLVDEEFVASAISAIFKRKKLIFPRSRGMHWPYNAVGTDRVVPTEEQEAAIDMAREMPLFVVSGKPGTGKTTTVLRSIHSMFEKDMVLSVSFTGLAASRLASVTGQGNTVHSILHDIRTNKSERTDIDYTVRRILIVEEASTLSLHLFADLLREMPNIERLYMVGDHNQMSPPGGGAGLLAAFCRRYAGTSHMCHLNQSMRVDSASTLILRNLVRILDGDINLEYATSATDSDNRSAFVVLPRSKTVYEDIAMLRSLFGNGPDHELDMQIMVQKNDTRKEMLRLWFQTGPFGNHPYKEHEVYVGETVMFLKNNNYDTRMYGCKYRSEKVMNGTIDRVAEIFDVNVAEGPHSGDEKRVQCTDEARSFPSCRRFIKLHTLGTTVCLDTYGGRNIVRSQPATMAKMQGQETGTAVVYIHQGVTNMLGRHDFYTACSRGKKRVIIVTDTVHTVEDGIPREIAWIIKNNRRDHTHSCLWQRLPSADSLISTLSSSTTISTAQQQKKQLKRRKPDRDTSDEDGDDDDSGILNPQKRARR